jgi:hypothetical protein
MTANGTITRPGRQVFSFVSYPILFRFLYFLTKVKPGHSMPWQNHGLLLLLYLLLLLPIPKGSAAA